MKTLKEFWGSFYHTHCAELSASYPGLSIDRFLREVGDILHCDMSSSELSFSQSHYQMIADKLLKGIPFPYLLQESEFFHHKFFVNENVLIPRPETELLVDMIVRNGRKFEKVLDVGTGSGVILLSLMKAKIAKLGTGSDISDKALMVAKINQRRLRLSCDFIQSDRFQNITEKFDLVVSNPPYIKARAHRSEVQATVDSFEPHLALYLADADYEVWFESFFRDVFSHLNSGGEFWMEGHEKELDHQVELLEKAGFSECKIFRDLSGLARFITGKKTVTAQ